MTCLAETDYGRLLAEFPIADHDLERAIADLERRCRAGDVTSPYGLVRSWLRGEKYRRQAGQMPATPIPVTPLGERSDPGYAAFRLGLINRVLDGLTPAELADALAEHFAKFEDLPGGVGELIDREIAAYRVHGEFKSPTNSDAVELFQPEVSP